MIAETVTEIRKPRLMRRTWRRIGTLARIVVSDDYLNWDKLAQGTQEEKSQEAEWLKARIAELAPNYRKDASHSAELLAYERAHLELFCAKANMLPFQGMNDLKMRWLGFRVDHRPFRELPWQRAETPTLVQVVFPEGWKMEPSKPDDDPTGAIFADILDPENTVRFSVTYKNAPYELHAYLRERQPIQPGE